MKILVSAGEASGEMYAAPLVSLLKQRLPQAEFFGCAGPKMRAAGVRAVVDAASLSVVGLVEVVGHIPRVYKEFRKLVRAVDQERPALAILTDSPDFHLRLARKLKARKVQVVYLVAPQVWAWRKGRLQTLRRNVDRLLCIFPFEEKFFRDNRVSADYIGHPLTRMVKPRWERAEFFKRNKLDPDRPLIALLPGSRPGERARHLPILREAVARIRAHRDVTFVLGVPPGSQGPDGFQTIEGDTWDLLAYSDLALAASGTVTIEAALLGTPMVTYYKVTAVSWLLGKALVKTPFYTMVNLIAGRAVVPELMQDEMNPDRLEREAIRLLDDAGARDGMKRGLAEVAASLRSDEDPLERAARIVEELLRQRN